MSWVLRMSHSTSFLVSSLGQQNSLLVQPGVEMGHQSHVACGSLNLEEECEC
jgi:hypothetical protein